MKKLASIVFAVGSVALLCGTAAKADSLIKTDAVTIGTSQSTDFSSRHRGYYSRGYGRSYYRSYGYAPRAYAPRAYARPYYDDGGYGYGGGYGGPSYYGGGYGGPSISFGFGGGRGW